MLIPNLGPYVATHLQKVEDIAAVDVKREALEHEFDKRGGDFVGRIYDEKYPPDLWRFMKGHVRHPYHPYPGHIYYAPRENMLWFMEGLRFYLPLDLEYADRIWELYRSYEEQLRGQVALSNNISRTSPAWTYYNAASVLAGTDYSVYTHFMDQARLYRKELISYSRFQKGFSSMSFFTRMEMDETLTFAELADIESTQGREAVEKIMEAFIDEFWSNYLQGIPIFSYQPKPLSESIGSALPDMFILALLNVVLFLMAYASFMKQEVK